jgi:arylsulfatase A-like enzyme
MSSGQRPNVVLFVTDQWRAKDAGYCGNAAIQSPHIDRLAAEGAGFTRCFVQNPVSTPSRASMASGWYCHVDGHRTMHYMLRRHEPNMLRYFKEAGYHVWWGGKNDMLAEEVIPLSCHDRVVGTGGRETSNTSPWVLGDRLYHTFLWGQVPENYGMSLSDEYVAEQAVGFIEHPPAEPYFMLVNQTYPHPPYAVPEPYFSMYDRSSVPPPIPAPKGFSGKPRIVEAIHKRMRMDEITESELQEMVAVYYGMVTKTDHNLGRIIAALKASGTWDSTVVAATSDHGDFVGDYLLAEKTQNTFEDVLVNVPFAIRVPGCDPLPAPSDALVEMIDLLPTLAEACQIELGHTHFGRSLLPLLRGEATAHREYVFSEGGALRTEVHTHETDRPKENIYWSRPALQFTQPELHGKAVMIRSNRWKYVRRLYDTDELYDLSSDPEEVNNLIDEPSLAPVRHQLTAAMADWFIETGDEVPWRWDLRHPGEQHPEWSQAAATHGFAGPGG